jgi:hypothetical protein
MLRQAVILACCSAWKHSGILRVTLRAAEVFVFFVTRGAKSTGWPYTATKRTSLSEAYGTAATSRHAKRPYSRRCPAPGPKTAEELNIVRLHQKRPSRVQFEDVLGDLYTIRGVWTVVEPVMSD